MQKTNCPKLNNYGLRESNADMKKIFYIMVIIIMFTVSFLGCSKKSNPNNSNNESITDDEVKKIMIDYLDNKYNTKHTVSDIVPEGSGGPFGSAAYFYAEAYRNDNNDTFKVYVYDNGKKVKDSYADIFMRPKVQKLYSDITNAVWNESDVRVTLRTLGTDQNWTEASDAKELIQKENLMIDVSILISCKSIDESKEITKITDWVNNLLSDKLYGRLFIYYIVDSNQEMYQNALDAAEKNHDISKYINNEYILKKISLDISKNEIFDYKTISQAFMNE